MTDRHPEDGARTYRDGQPADNPEVRHEHSDVHVRPILAFVVGLLVTGVVVHLALAWLFFVLREREDRAKRSHWPLMHGPETVTLEERVERLPEPRLEGLDLQAPRHTLGRLRPSPTQEELSEQERQLRQGQGPSIEEAMRQVVEEAKQRAKAEKPR